MEEPTVLLSRDGAVSTIALNRPHRKNAIDERTWGLLQEALREVGQDRRTRAVVITGAGGDFCAGADIGSEREEPHPLPRMHRINDVALALHELDKPTVAKVSGIAVGAGWNMALACDLVAASDDARFSQIFARRALSVDFGGSWLLPRIVGLQQAKRLALLADFVGAEEAYRLGLVTWVKSAGELDAFVAETAAELAAGPPMALAQTKKLLEGGVNATLREALENEARAQTINFATADVPVALRAFRDKTEPYYTGDWAVPEA
ncbi:2-(1,2-epoxy-1,2-dihydrophenyl)acetyl-CoA isomerase [Saccharopolyspora lacisalsi]|uniref:2-(1,2-epoxy-1,2-dihydrophenyl)acetyl-CoA isomerase n=1 Tax=Halosaccharopolyspora lacisalsi TaxID=1000566 RepID=A0A839E346_9PSEU|nr:enoyl-CoA hydratase-related protein [Halosaccharopolyspora lacisalsi]MBA8826185.1 2-(1,2-epoxy-1,2-dihydrophenyl)acetyl-CoA isomerase [Halosaccharopolyspora lacisalsi]